MKPTAMSPRLPFVGRPGVDTPTTLIRKSCRSLEDKVVTRVDGEKQSRSELEEILARVREQYQTLLMLLKELELGRIDLQATAHFLSSTRQNWRQRYTSCRGLQPPSELYKRLEDEEIFFAGEVQDADQQIGLVSAKVLQLRDVRDSIERKLVEQRRVLVRSDGVLETLRIGMKNLPPHTYSAITSGKGGPPRTALVQPKPNLDLNEPGRDGRW